jgi:rubrerythrin
MELNTTSAAISFAKKLEEDSAKFYENLSRWYAPDEDTFLSLVRENKKNAAQIERVYYEVISDAIEGCFAFGINLDNYTFKSELPEKTSYPDALKRAVEMEDKIIKFYSDAAEQSKSLMADVPRAFALIAKKREKRRSLLTSLLARDADTHIE